MIPYIWKAVNSPFNRDHTVPLESSISSKSTLSTFLSQSEPMAFNLQICLSEEPFTAQKVGSYSHAAEQEALSPLQAIAGREHEADVVSYPDAVARSAGHVWV